jgi:hypothetical protein
MNTSKQFMYKKRLHSPRLAFPYILTGLFLIEVNNMDLFWSGLARRASKHTWNERRSQFSKVLKWLYRIFLKKEKNENQLW